MKHTNKQPLDVRAFGIASGSIGLIFSILLGGMMRSYGAVGSGWMMGAGFQTSGGVILFMSFWMGIILGIVGGAFAWFYNALAQRLNE